MATLQITEFADSMVRNGVGTDVAPAINEGVQVIDGSSAAAGSALQPTTRLVKVLAIGGDVNAVIAKSGQTASGVISAADGTHERFLAGVPEWRFIRGNGSDLAFYAINAV